MTEVEEHEETFAPDDLIDLEDELIEHLGVPESAMAIYREQISEDLLLKDEKGGKTLLPFVIGYIEKHGQAPTSAQIVHELGGHFTKPSTPVEWIIEQLRDRHERIRAKKIVSHLATLAVKDPHAATQYALEQFGDVARATASRQGVLLIDDWENQISEYNQRVLAGKLRGFSLGFPEIDEVTGGLRPGTMTFVCGRPKTSKSFMLLKAAVANALGGARIHFETMELREDEMYGRFQCMVAGVSYSRYFKGTLDKDDLEKLHEAGELLQQTSGQVRFVHASPDERTVRHVCERAKAWAPDIVEIDQFSFLTSTGVGNKPHERDKHTVYEIKDILTPLWPVFIAAQFNREAGSLTEMANLEQIGLTDAIGQAADLVLGIHSNKEMRESRMLQYGVVAARASEWVRGLISNQIGMNGDLKWIERCDD